MLTLYTLIIIIDLIKVHPKVLQKKKWKILTEKIKLVMLGMPNGWQLISFLL